MYASSLGKQQPLQHCWGATQSEHNTATVMCLRSRANPPDLEVCGSYHGLHK